MAFYSNYRFVIKNLQGGTSNTNVAIAEVELRESLSTIDETTNTGGTASASGDIGASYVASKAVDDSSSTMWNAGSSSTNLANDDVWWEFEFITPREIGEYTIQARPSYLDDSPTEWELWAGDGVTWTTIATEAVADWSASEIRVFYIGTPPPGDPVANVTRLATEIISNLTTTPVVWVTRQAIEVVASLEAVEPTVSAARRMITINYVYEE